MMQRRSFFKLLAGAMLAPVVPQIAEAMTGEVMPDNPHSDFHQFGDPGPVAKIWGDMIHDDAPGLNALLRGEVVEFAEGIDTAGVGWISPTTLVMPPGTFLTLAPIEINGDGDVHFSNVLIEARHSHPMLIVDRQANAGDLTIYGGHFRRELDFAGTGVHIKCRPSISTEQIRLASEKWDVSPAPVALEPQRVSYKPSPVSAQQPHWLTLQDNRRGKVRRI